MRSRARQLDLSDADVARGAGLSTRRYGNYVEDKRQPDFDTFKIICRELQTTPDYILGVAEEPEAHTGNSPDQPPVHVDMSSYVEVARIDVPVGMGEGGIADFEYEHSEPVLFQHQLITAELRANPDDIRYMEVRGPSMSPLLETRDQVLIDTRDRNPSQPGIFVLWDGDGLVCKWVQRVAKSEPKKLKITSENTRFDPYNVLEEEANIVGRVVWYARRI